MFLAQKTTTFARTANDHERGNKARETTTYASIRTANNKFDKFVGCVRDESHRGSRRARGRRKESESKKRKKKGNKGEKRGNAREVGPGARLDASGGVIGGCGR